MKKKEIEKRLLLNKFRCKIILWFKSSELLDQTCFMQEVISQDSKFTIDSDKEAFYLLFKFKIMFQS